MDGIGHGDSTAGLDTLGARRAVAPWQSSPMVRRAARVARDWAARARRRQATVEVTFKGQSGAQWRYRTDKPLGRPGYFGAVFEAVADNGEPMAVKVVRKRSDVTEELLLREVEIGRHVSKYDGCDDVLMPALDIGDRPDAFLLVMKRADHALSAETLPMTEAEAVLTLIDITESLQALHSIAILHRDMKPANVLFHEGRWKLADFGIARSEEIGTQSPTFRGWGSAPYKAPETWEDKPANVKTDLYSLGCIAFELLSGKPPYDGDKAAMREGHLRGDVPSIPTGNVSLENLVKRLLAKEPGARPQDARAVLERLRRVSIPRTPVQEAIARGFGVHADERMREQQSRMAAEAARDARRQNVLQGLADIQEIFADTLEVLQGVEPDAELIGNGRSLELATDEAQLKMRLWEASTGVARDTMMIAGHVEIKNRRLQQARIAANLAYEQVGDRLAWNVYKFKSEFFRHADYRDADSFEGMHGLRWQDFTSENLRRRMIQDAGIHQRLMSIESLDFELLAELFREAVDLRPPDPNIWQQ